MIKNIRIGTIAVLILFMFTGCNLSERFTDYTQEEWITAYQDYYIVFYDAFASESGRVRMNYDNSQGLFYIDFDPSISMFDFDIFNQASGISYGNSVPFSGSVSIVENGGIISVYSGDVYRIELSVKDMTLTFY
jgi:hypothetical protein